MKRMDLVLFSGEKYIYLLCKSAHCHTTLFHSTTLYYGDPTNYKSVTFQGRQCSSIGFIVSFLYLWFNSSKLPGKTMSTCIVQHKDCICSGCQHLLRGQHHNRCAETPKENTRKQAQMLDKAERSLKKLTSIPAVSCLCV